MPEQTDDLEMEQAKKIVADLVSVGYKWVYINTQTGRYRGEESVTDLDAWYRPQCHHLDPDTKLSLNREDLEQIMYQLLVHEIKPVDVRLSLDFKPHR